MSEVLDDVKRGEEKCARTAGGIANNKFRPSFYTWQGSKCLLHDAAGERQWCEMMCSARDASGCARGLIAEQIRLSYAPKSEVRFLKYLRQEQKFENLDALKNQIAVDVRKAREFCPH